MLCGTTAPFEPTRLAMARKLAALPVGTLAERIGRPRRVITDCELGRTPPSSDLLQRLARALDVPVGFFRSGRPQLRLDTTDAHFRSLPAHDLAPREKALATIELLWEVLLNLEDVVELPDTDMLLELAGTAEPKQAARQVRRWWGVGRGPVIHLIRHIETNGIVPLHAPGGQDPSLPEFSTPAGGRPIIYLTDDDDPHRRRFRAAHELGHLVMHPQPAPGSTHREASANAFAAELLMPERELAGHFPAARDFTALNELARAYGVSSSALADRGKALGAYSTTEHHALRRMLRQLAPTAGGPEQLPGEDPQVLHTALDVAASEGRDFKTVADRLQTTTGFLRIVLGLRDERPALQLVGDH